ncbi:hypothetical protein THAOC_14966, partial [Thalassiosira oceanica]
TSSPIAPFGTGITKLRPEVEPVTADTLLLSTLRASLALLVPLEPLELLLLPPLLPPSPPPTVVGMFSPPLATLGLIGGHPIQTRDQKEALDAPLPGLPLFVSIGEAFVPERPVNFDSIRSEFRCQIVLANSSAQSPVGINKFVLQADAPDRSQIPEADVLGVTVVLVTCSYRNKEFVRVGYYVNNEYAEPYDEEKGPPLPLDINKVRRVVLSDKPRVTRFPIKWGHNDSEDEKQKALQHQQGQTAQKEDNGRMMGGQMLTDEKEMLFDMEGREDRPEEELDEDELSEEGLDMLTEDANMKMDAGPSGPIAVAMD